MDRLKAFAMGRYQPYSHRHHEANLFMANQINAEVLEIWVDTTHDERLPTSPMIGENIREAVEKAYDDFYETGLKVEVKSRDALGPAFYLDVIKRARNGHTFVTGEETHARRMSRLKPFFHRSGYQVGCWAEDEKIFRNSDFHMMGSATDIRKDISRGDGPSMEWRKSVSDPVEDAIDENYSKIVRTLESKDKYYGSKYRDIIASRGGFYRAFTDIHHFITR